MSPKKKLPPELDPILPLPVGTGIPPIEQGDGKKIMQREDTVMVVLPYRSFYFLWEHAERQAAKEYPKYVGTTMDHAAQTWLDAVHAFRNAAAGQDLKRYPESTAKKARAAWERILKKRAAAAKGKKDVPEGAATEPQEANPEPKRAKAPRKRSASRTEASKGSKRAAARKPRSAKRTQKR